MDLLQYLRMQNMFGDPKPLSAGDMGPPVDNIPVRTGLPIIGQDADPPLTMEQLYTPETEMTGRLKGLLDSIPTRGEPSVMHKIFASLAGGARGPQAASDYLMMPYNQAYTEWKDRFDPTLQAANQERYQNANMRQIAASMVNQDRLERGLQRQIDRDAVIARQGNQRIDQGWARVGQGDRRLDQGDRRLDQGDRSLDIREKVARGGVFEVDDAGNAYMVYKDGTVQPVDMSFLSYEQKSEMMAKRALAIAKARESGKRDRVQLKPVYNAAGDIVTWEVFNLDEATRTPALDEAGEPGQVPQSELEEGREVTNKAKQVKSEHPEWSNYIEFDKTGGKFKRIKPPSLLNPFSPNKETYDAIYQAIYGTAPPPSEASPAPKSVTPASARKGEPAPKQADLPPPPNQREDGMTWTFPNGTKGKWDKANKRWIKVG